MFNLGPLELLAILVVALLVFGPEKLPEIGKQVGRAVQEFRKFQASMQANVRDVIDPITGQITGPMTSNNGPPATNIRGGNIPRSATIQEPEASNGESALPPGTFGYYADPVAPAPGASLSSRPEPAAGPPPSSHPEAADENRPAPDGAPTGEAPAGPPETDRR